MRRTLRLFVYAAAMLVVAVGVAAALRDDPGAGAGRSEVSGKLVGLTEFQEQKEKSAASAPAETRTEAPRATGAAPADTRPALAEETTGAQKERAAAPALKEEKPAESVRTPAQPAEEKAAPAAERTDAPQVAPAVEKPAPAAEKPAPAAEKTAPAADKDAASYERVVTSARFSMQGSQIKLILQGNAPMVGHYFTLGDPDRVVLDLAGNWEITLPRVPSNRLIQSVRVGQHDDKTRIVFDMKTMGKIALVPLNRNALELRIQ